MLFSVRSSSVFAKGGIFLIGVEGEVLPPSTSYPPGRQGEVLPALPPLSDPTPPPARASFTRYSEPINYGIKHLETEIAC